MSQWAAVTPNILAQVLTLPSKAILCQTKRASIAADRYGGESLNKEAQDLGAASLLDLLCLFYVM